MKYENLVLDEERALYGIHDAEIKSCTFAGKADGESALKECQALKIADCRFELRYPLWHVQQAEISDCILTDTCRAALWYDQGIHIRNSELGGNQGSA